MQNAEPSKCGVRNAEMEASIALTPALRAASVSSQESRKLSGQERENRRPRFRACLETTRGAVFGEKAGWRERP